MIAHLELALHTELLTPNTGFERILAPQAADDTLLFGDPQAANRIREAKQLLRLSLEHEEADLSDLQQQAAATIEALELPSTATVVDLLSLDARPVEAALARLRDLRPPAWIWLGVRPRQDDLYDVETFGFRKLGLREIFVPAVAPKHLDAIQRLLNQAFVYICRTKRPLQTGDAMPFGWVDVRLGAAEGQHGFPAETHRCAPRWLRETTADPDHLPGIHILHEPENDAADAAWVVGVARAARMHEQLEGAARQCGLEAQVPRGASSAAVCNRLAKAATVLARRVAPEDPQSSGWVAVCQQEDHDHDDPEQLEMISLMQLASRAPRLFALLAAPPGTGLLCNHQGELTILPPDA